MKFLISYLFCFECHKGAVGGSIVNTQHKYDSGLQKFHQVQEVVGVGWALYVVLSS